MQNNRTKKLYLNKENMSFIQVVILGEIKLYLFLEKYSKQTI